MYAIRLCRASLSASHVEELIPSSWSLVNVVCDSCSFTLSSSVGTRKVLPPRSGCGGPTDITVGRVSPGSIAEVGAKALKDSDLISLCGELRLPPLVTANLDSPEDANAGCEGRDGIVDDFIRLARCCSAWLKVQLVEALLHLEHSASSILSHRTFRR
jgi:hypothetical protein